MVSVAVSDNGIGIANSNPDEILEPNFTTREAGTGLGLAICRTIIETHGGKITANNHVSPDSTRITCTLPVARSQAVIARYPSVSTTDSLIQRAPLADQSMTALSDSLHPESNSSDFTKGQPVRSNSLCSGCALAVLRPAPNIRSD